jgi:hypothetical protein
MIYRCWNVSTWHRALFQTVSGLDSMVTRSCTCWPGRGGVRTYNQHTRIHRHHQLPACAQCPYPAASAETEAAMESPADDHLNPSHRDPMGQNQRESGSTRGTTARTLHLFPCAGRSAFSCRFVWSISHDNLIGNLKRTSCGRRTALCSSGRRHDAGRPAAVLSPYHPGRPGRWSCAGAGRPVLHLSESLL